MSTGGTTGQVLGASATFAAGVYMLPNTGTDTLSTILPIVAITVGAVVLATLVITRIIRAAL